MSSPATLYVPAELNTHYRIEQYSPITLLGALPLDLVAICHPYGIMNLGQLYALDCHDLRHRLRLTDGQISLLERLLKTDQHPPVAADKTGLPLRLSTGDRWVSLSWPWLPATDPAAHMIVASSIIEYLPPLWFCRTASQMFAMDWLLTQGLATTVDQLRALSQAAVATSLHGLVLQRPIEGRQPDTFTPDDIMACSQLVIGYITEILEANSHG